MLCPVYLGSSSQDQAVRIKIQEQKWGKDSYYQHHGKCSRLGGETGSIPRAKVIISFVGDSHETFVPYGHVSFVKEVYPDDSFLVSETNVDGRRFSQADSAMSFSYTTKRRVFT